MKYSTSGIASVILGVALIIAISSVVKHHLTHQAEQQSEIRQRAMLLELSKEESRRWQIFAETMKSREETQDYHGGTDLAYPLTHPGIE